MLAYRQKIAIVYVCAYFMDLMNSSIANVAFPTIGRELHASISQLSWVMTAYILGLTLVIPISGWLSDKFGTKKIFMTSLTIFGLGSLLCGFSHNILELIFWRFIQGFGGGLLIPVGQTMLFRHYVGHERAKISATVMIPAVIAPTISPTIGGVLVEHFQWSSAFFVNVPLVILIAIFAGLVLKEEKQEKSVKVDFIGLILLSASLFLLLYACYLFGNIASFKEGIIFLIACFVVMVIFLYRNSRVLNPILHLSLYQKRSFGLGTTMYFLVTIPFASINLVTIYYFQNVLGVSPAMAGQLTIAMGLGLMLGLKISSYIYQKINSRKIILMALIPYTAAPLLFMAIDSSTQYVFACVLFFIFGVSASLMFNTIQPSSYMDIEHHQMAQATSIFNLKRQMGLSLGVGLASLILTVSFALFPMIMPTNMLNNPLGIHIYHMTYLMIGLFNLIPFSLMFFFKEKKSPRSYMKESQICHDSH